LVAGGPGGNNRDTRVSLGHISNIITTIIQGIMMVMTIINIIIMQSILDLVAEHPLCKKDHICQLCCLIQQNLEIRTIKWFKR